MIKLFSCSTSAHVDESLVDMPGFSHRGQPFKVQVFWYPFEEWKVKAYLFAKNRTHALKQLHRAGIRDIRDLDGGSKHPTPDCILKRL